MLLPTHTDTASAQLQRISLYPIFSSGLTIIGSYRDFVSIRQASRLSVACNLDRWHRLNQLPAECDSHEHRNKVSQNSAMIMSVNDFVIWMRGVWLMSLLWHRPMGECQHTSIWLCMPVSLAYHLIAYHTTHSYYVRQVVYYLNYLTILEL